MFTSRHCVWGLPTWKSPPTDLGRGCTWMTASSCTATGSDSNTGPLTSGRVLENEAGGSLDDFTPASRKGKAREHKMGALQSVKEAAALEAKAAAQASSAEEILELWDSWTRKVCFIRKAGHAARADDGNAGVQT